jgi:hypothetical protein
MRWFGRGSACALRLLPLLLCAAPLARRAAAAGPPGQLSSSVLLFYDSEYEPHYGQPISQASPGALRGAGRALEFGNQARRLPKGPAAPFNTAPPHANPDGSDHPTRPSIQCDALLQKAKEGGSKRCAQRLPGGATRGQSAAERRPACSLSTVSLSAGLLTGAAPLSLRPAACRVCSTPTQRPECASVQRV